MNTCFSWWVSLGVINPSLNIKSLSHAHTKMVKCMVGLWLCRATTLDENWKWIHKNWGVAMQSDHRINSNQSYWHVDPSTKREACRSSKRVSVDTSKSTKNNLQQGSLSHRLTMKNFPAMKPCNINWSPEWGEIHPTQNPPSTPACTIHVSISEWVACYPNGRHEFHPKVLRSAQWIL